MRLFHAKKKLQGFLLYNVCNHFFRSSVSTMKTSMKVLSIETKVLYVLDKSKPNSYSAIGKAQLNTCAFSDRVEKQKCCLGPGDIKTVITFLLYNFEIKNLAGCFVTAIATACVIFTFLPLLE